jgi:hypothetical protein
MIKLVDFWNLGASPRKRGVGLSAIMKTLRVFIPAPIPCAAARYTAIAEKIL